MLIEVDEQELQKERAREYARIEMEATKNFMKAMGIDAEAMPEESKPLTAEQQAEVSKAMIKMFKAVNEPEKEEKKLEDTESFSQEDLETLQWAKELSDKA